MGYFREATARLSVARGGELCVYNSGSDVEICCVAPFPLTTEVQSYSFWINPERNRQAQWTANDTIRGTLDE